MEQEFTEFRESDKSLKHESGSHMCLAGAVLACWFVAQEVVGSNTHFLQKYFSSFMDSVDSTEFI